MLKSIRDDGQLLAEFSETGVDEAFTELVRRHGGMVLNVCRRLLGSMHDAEDAAQAVFLVLAAKAKNLKRSPSVAGWLHQVARNVASSALRTKRARAKRERDTVDMVMADTSSNESHDEWVALEPFVDDELGALPEKYRTALILFHLEGRSLRECADTVRCKPGALGVRLGRGREMLRDRLARRAATLSVGLLAAFLTERTAVAQVSATFTAATTKAASLVVAGQAANPIVPVQVSTLCKGAAKMLFLAKVKAAAVLMAAFCVLGGAGAVATRILAEDKPAGGQQPPTDNPAGGESLAPPAFTKKPAATPASDHVKITFAVNRETDVAVFIENDQGEIVRHLVAGVLGKNPPEPLKADALEQSIVWDRKDDDGQPATGGQFKARVGLGLKSSYAGLAFADKDKTGPNHLETISGIACGDDGRLYALDFGGIKKIHVFLRTGAYEKTIKPFPSTLSADRVKASGALPAESGRFLPVIHRPGGFTFYPSEEIAQQPAIAGDKLMLLGPSAETGTGRSPTCVSILGTDGSMVDAPTAPLNGIGTTGFPHQAVSADGKWLYSSGLGAYSEWGPAATTHAIYRIALPARASAEVFFGTSGQTGADSSHLNNPQGIACDGKGHLLVSDWGNNRILVINENDKSVFATITVPEPTWLAVERKSGAIYVCSKLTSVLKLSGKEFKEAARADCSALIADIPAANRSAGSICFALDASAEPTVLWMASRGRLVHSEERGSSFSEPKAADYYVPQFYKLPTTDPYKRLVASRTAGWGATVEILEEATGQTRRETPGGSSGANCRIGPDGTVYTCDHNQSIFWNAKDSTGKVVAKRLPGNVGSSGTTGWERDFSIARNGDIYVRVRGPEYHGLMTVDQYDRDGTFKRKVLWSVTDAMYGPRLDPKGNLYILESIKPKGQPFPDEFNGKSSVNPGWYDRIYGSVVKFGPQGGAIWFNGDIVSPLSFEGWTSAGLIKDMMTTGGNLVGSIAKNAPSLNLPLGMMQGEKYSKLVFRLKNESDAAEASLTCNMVSGGGDRSLVKVKKIAIKPNSDFAEYSFDLWRDAEFEGLYYCFVLSPSLATSGRFKIDWVRCEGATDQITWNFNEESDPDKLFPATMKKLPAEGSGAKKDATIQAALWMHEGFSPVIDMQGCGTEHCKCADSTDFDADNFGRVFAPDIGRFRIAALDTNGNLIGYIGAYGNQDCLGSDSYVVDPTGKFLRPRQANDPKDIKSPSAEPDIAFAWISGLAVTDRFAYVSDVINKRMLRIALDYATTETCPVR